MIKINKTIIVEGNYDKIKLSRLVDAHIIATDGFRIFKNADMRALISALAKKEGIIILTDSDRAGFSIRNYIKGFVKEGEILNVYIPDIKGKEKRKKAPSKEGTLGVEGINDEILIRILEEMGDTKSKEESVSFIEFYSDGFAGGEKSREKREKFCKECSLPSRLSSKELLKVINSLYSNEEYKNIVNKIS